MPITDSGEIALIADIAAEYTSIGTTDVSLEAARDAAGLSAGQVAMTQFYNLSDVVVPTVATNASSSVGSSSMTINGNVTNAGGGTISERGFYFGTSTNATSNTKYTVSGTTGSFSRSMTGLSGGTTYRAFAFATNEAGTTIGSMVTQATATPTVASGVSTSGFRYGSYFSEVDIFPSGGYYTNNTGTTITFSMTGSLNKCNNTPAGPAVTKPGTFTLGNGSTWTSGASFQRSGGGNGYLVASASGYTSTSYHIFGS